MRIYYAGIRFTEGTNTALNNFRSANNLRAYPKPSMGFHSTFAYSRNPFHLDLCVVPQFSIAFVGDKLELWGNVLVLPYESEFLIKLHKLALHMGATWDQPNYIPHITIAKDFTGDCPGYFHHKIPVQVLEIFYSEWDQA